MFTKVKEALFELPVLSECKVIGPELQIISFVGVYNDTVNKSDFGCSLVDGKLDAVGDYFLTFNDIEETKCSFGVKVDKTCDREALISPLIGVLCVVNIKLIFIAFSIVAFF